MKTNRIICKSGTYLPLTVATVLLVVVNLVAACEPDPEPISIPQTQVTCGDGTVQLVPDQDADDVPDEAACDWSPDLIDCDPEDPSVGYPSAAYPDEDGDGYTLAEASVQCPGDYPLRDFPSEETDCDDADPDIHPDAEDICDDGIDQDCDGADLACTEVDGDGDGYSQADGDCDDGDTDINPDAEETCNGIDDDCDGDTDEGVLVTYYRDNDGDAYGTGLPHSMCAPEAPYTAPQPGDCDDNDATVHPNADETCNGVDDDCDGDTDESDAEDATPWYRDADGDGYGNSLDTEMACTPPAGYVAPQDDCDDSDSTVYPGAEEVCNGVDENCDGSVDEEVTTPFYVDSDGDGFGNATEVVLACTAPAGYVLNPADCDDTNAGIYPGAQETCNDGFDQDCNGYDLSCSAVDEDGDGYSEAEGDCDDGDNAVYPGASESCNLRDDDCDSEIDEGFAQQTYYQDSDGDGYGDPNNAQAACSRPPGYLANAGDCDDTNADLHPGGMETCGDGIDQDCDGYDLSCSDVDGDRDGYTENQGDCDDTNPTVNPEANEVCNEQDDDCDGDTDEGVQTTYYRDNDGDGYGDPANALVSCSRPPGYVTGAGDCDDSNAATYLGGQETCGDGIDQDCDGYDLSCSDVDGDGDGYTGNQGDCDDTDPTVNPAANEVCNEKDDDCDGDTDEGVQTTFYQDNDGDGFGTPWETLEACSLPAAGYAADNRDCDDTDAAVNPGADEVCNERDDDCDGEIDESLSLHIYYADEDGDGYGQPDNTVEACALPPGYAEVGHDCDDADSAANPGADEVCNERDDDCDGEIDEEVLTTYYQDHDGDGYGTEYDPQVGCSPEPNYAPFPGDCDDLNPDVSPGATELPGDGVDNDCDGFASSIVRAAGGSFHTIVLDSLGHVWAWGSNWSGQLGNGSTDSSAIPVQVVTADGSPLTHVAAIAAGDSHSMALLVDGTVWAWGENGQGQLGNGNNVDRLTPTRVSRLSDVQAIDAGYAHSLALLDNGTVRAWGYNGHGELGNGSTRDSNIPIEVSGISSVLSIAAGSYHSLARAYPDEVIFAWGANDYGQLGNGTWTNSTTPDRITTLYSAVDIAAGERHSLALLVDGTVRAWGDDYWFQLGNGTQQGSSASPVKVSDLSNVVAVASGAYHSLAILADGTVRAWGNNSQGQLGDGSTESRAAPVQVSNLSGVRSLSAGERHSIAVLNDGTVCTWGANANSQLGTGDTNDRHLPTEVMWVQPQNP